MTLVFGRPTTHVCHVCVHQYRVEYPRFSTGRPRCCPVCDAPRRTANICEGNGYDLLLTLSDPPANTSREQYYETLAEQQILDFARTCVDIDALVDTMRWACTRLETPASAGPARDDHRKAAVRAAEIRLLEQRDSGLLEWRLGDLHERAIALLCAEHEHHRHDYTVRCGRAPPDHPGRIKA